DVERIRRVVGPAEERPGQERDGEDGARARGAPGGRESPTRPEERHGKPRSGDDPGAAEVVVAELLLGAEDEQDHLRGGERPGAEKSAQPGRGPRQPG